ncbi:MULTISPECIES: DUF6600 domain-containing protein [Burkholderia]|uniref:DUF6600 domain-containing protein n=1 Tax=Burkholderia TaxID=32008 RepID=UPI00084125A2|nr:MULTISPECIES: DUF6600 domain-containing protein [unclassified Burkholderia]AOK29172.1 FecR protein [Burkholderia sp. Bp7605]
MSAACALPNLPRIARYTIAAAAALAAWQPAFAQTFDARAAAAAAAQQPDGDPPSRVARLNYLSGAVTTEPAGASDWSYAAVNRPLTTGDQLWNDAGARSELHIGSSAVRLGQSTSLSILNLDDTNAQLKVPLGTLSTHVRDLAPGTSYEIDTPNLALAVGSPGDYRVDVAPDGASTAVTVRRGSATVYGDNTQMPVSAGQRVVFTGTALQVADTAAAPPPDSLDEWAASRDAAEERSVSARYVSRDIPGYQDLDANGTWRDTPDYGEVWVPSAVPADWAPYRTGHWIWQAPWGWTWIDDQPWGFAPYHYGRWAYVGDAWAWVPGPLVVSAPPPCYAPALVAFVGGAGGGFDWSVSLAIGGIAAAGVAWFPLGPRDPWRPSWGGWSPHYYLRVNQTVIVNNGTINTVNVNKTVNVTNITNIHNTYVNFHAPNAVTAVPATAFVHGQPVAHFAQKVDPQQWRNARIGSGAPGLAPVRQSLAGELRNAAYRPPAAVEQRSIVATRNPVVPAAYRDRLAAHLVQSGALVPGAGVPVVKTTAPPNYAMRQMPAIGNTGEPSHWAMRNVQLVDTHTPLAPPLRGPQPGGGNPAAAARAIERAQASAPPANATQPEMPQNNAARGTSVPPNAMRPVNPAPSVNNGVPRPPALDEPSVRNHAGTPGDTPRAQPSWSVPHPPIAQQRASGANDRPAPASPAQPRPSSGAPNPLPDYRPPAPSAPPPIRAARSAPTPQMPSPVSPQQTWQAQRNDFAVRQMPHGIQRKTPPPNAAPRNDYRPPASLPPMEAPRAPRPTMEAPRIEPRPAPSPQPAPRAPSPPARQAPAHPMRPDQPHAFDAHFNARRHT